MLSPVTLILPPGLGSALKPVTTRTTPDCPVTPPVAIVALDPVPLLIVSPAWNGPPVAIL